MTTGELGDKPIASEAMRTSHLTSHIDLEPVPSDAMEISYPASQGRDGDSQLLGSDWSLTRGTDSCSNSYTDTESDDSQSVSLERECRLGVLRSKHTLLATLMQDVYAIFEKGWIGAAQEHTSPSSSAPSNFNLQPDNSTLSRGQKRPREDRDSTPPKDGQDGKRKSHQQSPASGKVDRLFACSFYKYDCMKYSCNAVNGSKYRACAGPGFNTISHLRYSSHSRTVWYDRLTILRQHLQRKHSAPIQCTRCWLVMVDLHTMSIHANQEVRCKREEPRPEGISLDKMELIKSKHGATWSDIYSIIFPGAPIPSPCKFDSASLRTRESWLIFMKTTTTILRKAPDRDHRDHRNLETLPISKRTVAGSSRDLWKPTSNSWSMLRWLPWKRD